MGPGRLRHDGRWLSAGPAQGVRPCACDPGHDLCRTKAVAAIAAAVATLSNQYLPQLTPAARTPRARLGLAWGSPDHRADIRQLRRSPGPCRFQEDSKKETI
jgi:hypothetical protein